MVCLLSNFLIEKSKARFSLENAIWKRGKTEGKRLKRRERERERETSERDERARERGQMRDMGDRWERDEREMIER